MNVYVVNRRGPFELNPAVAGQVAVRNRAACARQSIVGVRLQLVKQLVVNQSAVFLYLGTDHSVHHIMLDFVVKPVSNIDVDIDDHFGVQRNDRQVALNVGKVCVPAVCHIPIPCGVGGRGGVSALFNGNSINQSTVPVPEFYRICCGFNALRPEQLAGIAVLTFRKCAERQHRHNQHEAEHHADDPE
ncbi:hypothetical protein SDC9_82352 [bioreactor metagenome]|uniref:Uncharacterized protein n=1 Tax=bioreactor metagenome TaxID=1076179 RepID=A0A644Z654_9ZZZZ